MPTYHVTEIASGRRVGPPIVADSHHFILKQVVADAADADFDTSGYLVVKVNDNPPASVFTLVRPHEEAEKPAWELMTTGSRETAMREGQGRSGVSVVEETREVNRVKSRERRS